MAKKTKSFRPTHQEVDIAALAKAAGLEYDGDDDSRLFFDADRIDVYCHLLTAAEYKHMEREIGKATVKGEGYEVYAWNDSSGYKYWKAQGKVHDSNYIQVTASIKDSSKVDPVKLKSDVSRVWGMLCHWDNKDEWHSERLDQLERGRQKQFKTVSGLTAREHKCLPKVSGK